MSCWSVVSECLAWKSKGVLNHVIETAGAIGACVRKQELCRLRTSQTPYWKWLLRPYLPGKARQGHVQRSGATRTQAESGFAFSAQAARQMYSTLINTFTTEWHLSVLTVFAKQSLASVWLIASIASANDDQSACPSRRLPGLHT